MRKRKGGTKKDEEKTLFTVTCYLCGNKGHIMPNFPLVKRKIKIKRNLKCHRKRARRLTFYGGDKNLES